MRYGSFFIVLGIENATVVPSSLKPKMLFCLCLRSNELIWYFFLNYLLTYDTFFCFNSFTKLKCVNQFSAVIFCPNPKLPNHPFHHIRCTFAYTETSFVLLSIINFQVIGIKILDFRRA